MNRKHLVILTLIAGVFVVLAVAGRLGDGSGPIAGESAGLPFFDGLAEDLDRVDQIRIDGPGSERLVSLDRNDNGWVVAELENYPAATSQINSVLIELSEARIVEEKTADPEFYGRLGVEAIDSPQAAGIEVSVGTDSAIRWTAVIGDRDSGSQRYARISNADRSVLIDRDPEIPTDPTDWVFEEILDVPASRIQRVEISHRDGESLILSKDSPADADFSVDQVPPDRELQYPGIANVTGGLLEGLDLEAVERRTTEGEAGPIAEVVFRAFDGLLVRLAAEDADGGNAWISFEASADTAESVAEADTLNARLTGWRYRIPSYKYSQLTRRMEDLLQPVADE